MLSDYQHPTLSQDRLRQPREYGGPRLGSFAPGEFHCRVSQPTFLAVVLTFLVTACDSEHTKPLPVSAEPAVAFQKGALQAAVRPEGNRKIAL